MTALLSCIAAISAAELPAAHAKNGDTHITGVSETQTVDCGGGTLFVNGVNNVIHAMGVCWAVTLQGARNTIIAETVVNDITVYGSDQTVYFHNGDPLLFDRGRELGMTNRLQRVPE
ncbi:MAG TPA: DUF3060 domain-containing protein [Mycobacterium sp.]